ncbi:MAG: ATP-binding protein [Paracoccaceae bacterium]
MFRRILLAASLLALCIAAGFLGWQRAYDLGVAELRSRGATEMQLYMETTRGRLNQYRALAAVYARDPLVRAAVEGGADGPDIAPLNRRLEYWNAMSGSADTYVLDRDGLTIAASNWAQADSFVGNNFAFRPYYQMAITGQLGRFFGLGTTSGVRGYYFAFPIHRPGEITGAAVVKVSVARIERELAPEGATVFFTDRAGVIIISNDPDLRLRALGPIAPAHAEAILRDRQFDLGQIAPIDAGLFDGQLHLRQPMVPEGWTLHVVKSLALVRAQAWGAALLAGAVGLIIGLVAVVILQRRARLLERLEVRASAAQVLEAQVAARTADLTRANENLQRAQADLVQAAKLAALGQMSAALSHEFNQPLTAIRTYTDNALAFLGIGKREYAEENLKRVLRLTERMAELSRHLIGFARKPRETVRPTRLSDVIDETLSLMRGRIERADAKISVTNIGELVVMGGQVRLQHVMMNLLGNALDAALGAGRMPEIAIAASVEGGNVLITVDDNGPGIAPDLAEKVFDPFFSTKEVGQGLGLGLSISFNIMCDFGGTIEVSRNANGGARFTLGLPHVDRANIKAAE